MADTLTLNVVRKRWSDVVKRVEVETGSGLRLVTPAGERFTRHGATKLAMLQPNLDDSCR